MPRVKDLMEVGLTPIQSKHLGAQAVNGDFNNLTATGNASQADAYQIEANYNIFTTVGASTNSAKLPIAESDPHGVYFILNLGANALNLYPALGDNFNDLAVNTAIAIPVDCGAILVKQTDLSWQVHNTWGAVSPSILSGFVPYTGATADVNLGAFTITAANLSGTNTGDVTLAGTPDYITISGQTITRGQIDLTTDVTGVLPVANGGASGTWTAWSPTCGGFSAQPTNSVYRYLLNGVNGKACTLCIRQLTAGTSNATSFTIPLPFTAATITNMQWRVVIGGITDNGAGLTTAGLAVVESGATNLDLYTSLTAGGWTAANGKRVAALQITYEIA